MNGSEDSEVVVLGRRDVVSIGLLTGLATASFLVGGLLAAFGAAFEIGRFLDAFVGGCAMVMAGSVWGINGILSQAESDPSAMAPAGPPRSATSSGVPQTVARNDWFLGLRILVFAELAGSLWEIPTYLRYFPARAYPSLASGILLPIVILALTRVAPGWACGLALGENAAATIGRLRSLPMIVREFSRTSGLETFFAWAVLSLAICATAWKAKEGLEKGDGFWPGAGIAFMIVVSVSLISLTQ